MVATMQVQAARKEVPASERRPRDSEVCPKFTGREPAGEAIRRDAAAIWQRFAADFEPEKLYAEAFKAFKGMGCSAVDVDDFCMDLGDLQGDERFSIKAGILLSAMINAGEDEHYYLQINHLEKRIAFLGYRNIKRITVIGDANGHFASEMEAGSISIKGDVFGDVGRGLRDGDVTVEGDVYGHVGAQMESGTIEIRGDVGAPYLAVVNSGTPAQKTLLGDPSMTVGIGMKGGVISVSGFSGPLTGLLQEGGYIYVGLAGSFVGPRRKGGEINIGTDYESIARNPGEGSIYCGGKRIYPKEKNGEDKVLRELMDAWEVCRFDSSDIEGSYLDMLSVAKALGYSKDEILKFSRLVGAFEDEPEFKRKAGLFLSALVNGGEGISYTVDLSDSKGISMLGYRNTKILRAVGELGCHTALEMGKEGMMIVEGSSGYGTGAWQEGSLMVDGDAGDFLALGAKGGWIWVLGETGMHACALLDGGSVYMEKGYVSLGDVLGGQALDGRALPK